MNLPKLKTPVEVTVLPSNEFLEGRIKYLKNCIFWIEEYMKGSSSKRRLLEIAEAIEKHGKDIKEHISK